jgi:hypothetical protein
VAGWTVTKKDKRVWRNEQRWHQIKHLWEWLSHSRMGMGVGVRNSSGVGVGTGVGANNLSGVDSGVDF